MNEFLLDTNTVIDFFHDNPSVRARIKAHKLRYLSFITAAELLFGAKRSNRVAENLRQYREFARAFEILFADNKTLEVYSDLQADLMSRGRPIPSNDTWQAALAIQHNLLLVTSDSHFLSVRGLRHESWLV